MTDTNRRSRARKLLVPLAVVALALVAGCSAFGVGGGDSTGGTLTPVDVSTPISGDRPGSSADADTGDGRSPAPAGETDADESRSLNQQILTRLDAVYDERLSNTSYRIRTRLEFTVDGSDAGLADLQRRVAADERTAAGARRHIEVFRVRGLPAPANTSFAYVKFTNSSISATRYTGERFAEPRYRVTAEKLAATSDLAERARFERLMLAYDLELVRSSPDGDVLLRSETIAIPSVLATPAPATEINGGNLTVRVWSNDTISARAVYDVTVGEDSTGYIVQTYRLDRVGEVTVRPPGWISAAVREAEEA